MSVRSPWTLKAQGSSVGMIADAGEVRHALELFADPEGYCQVVTLRSNPNGAFARSRISTDLDGLVQDVRELPSGHGAYFQINPVRMGLTKKASAADIVKRRWMLFDIDPLKAEGCDKLSATKEEKEGALAACRVVHTELSDRNWPEPVVIDSGNGWYLVYRIDLPADEASQELIKGVLEGAAALAEGERCNFDKKVFDAPRLAKLPGTWAKKGEEQPDRPHRQARIVSIPSTVEVVTIEQLRSMLPAGGKGKGKPPAPTAKKDPFKLRTGESNSDRVYSLGGMENEKTILALTRPGDRDNQLFRSAAALGQLVAPGQLNESEITESLIEASRCCGLWEDVGEAKVLDVIRRGIERGKTTPRTIPQREASERNGHTPATARWSIPTEKGKGPDGPRIYTAPELMGLDLPDPRWAIPGLLSEGLTILAGKPKLGKSWMALNLALTIAGGGMALGSIRVQAGDVLYLALEDRLRRIRDRAAKVMNGIKMGVPPRLSVAVEWKRQDKGGVHDLAEWLSKAADPRLVVIDVWAKFRSPAKSKGSAYEQDYDQLTEVKSMADHYGASVLALHHTRKSAAEDVFDEISGTLGIAGAADGSLVLARARGKNEGTLAMTGRDIEEQTLAVEFVPETFTWKSHGSAEERYTGELQKKIVDYLRREGSARFVKDIASHLEKYEIHEVESVRKVVMRLTDKKVLRREGNAFSFPGEGGDAEHWTDH